jgi:hypothetical protein
VSLEADYLMNTVNARIVNLVGALEEHQMEIANELS